MGDAVFAFVQEIGKWKPVKGGAFRLVRRGKHKGMFAVKYLAGVKRWRTALVATVRVFKGE